jgi:hypothetical protein
MDIMDPTSVLEADITVDITLDITLGIMVGIMEVTEEEDMVAVIDRLSFYFQYFSFG